METSQTISIHAHSATKALSREASIINILSGLFSATKTSFSSVYGYLKEMLWYRLREIPNEDTLRELAESKKEIEAGNAISFSNPKDAIAYLNSITSARSD